MEIYLNATEPGVNLLTALRGGAQGFHEADAAS